MSSTEPRTALVTGASRGIGRAIALCSRATATTSRSPRAP